jgi:hypothetical protein
MRWLIIVLLVSLLALLLAAAAVACHICLQRAKLRRNQVIRDERALDTAEEADQDLEP